MEATQTAVAPKGWDALPLPVQRAVRDALEDAVIVAEDGKNWPRARRFLRLLERVEPAD